MDDDESLELWDSLIQVVYIHTSSRKIPRSVAYLRVASIVM